MYLYSKSPSRARPPLATINQDQILNQTSSRRHDQVKVVQPYFLQKPSTTYLNESGPMSSHFNKTPQRTYRENAQSTTSRTNSPRPQKSVLEQTAGSHHSPSSSKRVVVVPTIPTHSASRRIINHSPSPIKPGGVIREIIYLQRNSVSPIKSRQVELPQNITPQAVQALDQMFYSFEQQMKAKMSNLEQRARRLTAPMPVPINTTTPPLTSKRTEPTFRIE